MKLKLIMIVTALLVTASCEKPDNSLQIEEAKQVVQLSELRLGDRKTNAKMDDCKNEVIRLKWKYAQDMHRSGLLSERNYYESKLEYQISKLQGEMRDIEEAGIMLKIAKLRLKMLEANMMLPKTKLKDIGKD